MRGCGKESNGAADAYSAAGSEQHDPALQDSSGDFRPDLGARLLESALKTGGCGAAVIADAPDVPGFEIISRLGAGASGEVWLAEQQVEPNRTLALKILHHSGSIEASEHLLQREVRILARLIHPNLVLLHHAVTTADGRPGLAMEWIDGWPLDEWLDLHPDLTLPQKLELFQGIVRGVAFLHDHGVIHRDLKPANVIVDMHGVPKIVDFGLARLHQEGAVEITGGGTIGVAGTLNFMAPEQAADGEGARAMPVDVFALGAILYRILTGGWLRSPHKTPSETLALVLNPPPLQLPGSAQRLPADLLAILRRALATDPAHRYRHARDLESDLKNHSARLPVAARRHTVVYLTTMLLRRQARRSALAAALVVAGLFVSVMIYHRHRQVAVKNEANLRHAYALTSFTLGQLRDELRNANPRIGIGFPETTQPLPDTDDVLLPVDKNGELDLRYYQAMLADLRSATSEVHSHHLPALKSIQVALDLYSELSKESPDDPGRLLDSARTRLSFARLLRRVGRDPDAGTEARKVIRQLDRLDGRPGVDSNDLLPLRCDAIRFLARKAHLAGDSMAAYQLIVDMLAICKASASGFQPCPDDGVSPRLAMGVQDLATYALAADPLCIPGANALIADATASLRVEYNREPQSLSLASGLARCLHAAARIQLRVGPGDGLGQLYGEVAELLIGRPSDSKHLLTSLIWEISNSSTDWAGMVVDDPDPAIADSAVQLALGFTGHLRRNGVEDESVLFQRAKIYWFQSRLACRANDRLRGARFISKAMAILQYPHFSRQEKPKPILLTAQIMHHARSLSDLPEATWNKQHQRQLDGILKRLAGSGFQLTPEQQMELALISKNE